MSPSTLSIALDVPLEPAAAFDRVLEDVASFLAMDGSEVAMRLEARAGGGLVELRDGEQIEVATIRDWRPGERVLLCWTAADWAPEERTEVELRFARTGDGTRVTFEHRGWGGPVVATGAGNGAGAELVGWFAEQVLAPLVRATAPTGVATWLTDRHARRPTGPRARESYRDSKEHEPGFRTTLAALDLGADDVLLEVGCGGGAFLRLALRSGCRAVAVDHSPDMVRLTEETNAEAVAEGRLRVVQAAAEQLPLPDATFTCVASTHAFFFLEDPRAALAECHRVLAPGGRAAIYTAGPAMRGTPGAPEPIARWMHLYTAEELLDLAREAGFAETRVDRQGVAHLLLARRS